MTASTRLSPESIRMFSQVESPDVVIVLDETLLEYEDTTAGLQEKGWLIVNSPRDPQAIESSGRFSVAAADATGAAQDAGLIVAGSIMVNTAMLGAFARATGLIQLEDVRVTLLEKFPAEIAERNFDAARRAHDRTRMTPCAR